jgi:hypothetical protein
MTNLSCNVRGDEPPEKLDSFEDVDLDPQTLRNSGFSRVTSGNFDFGLNILKLCKVFLHFSVQAYAVPFILSGRDVFVRAPPGCGKTAAYLLPVLRNVLGRQRSNSGQ